jgi:L-lactate dehydrogenase (cytochrome)
MKVREFASLFKPTAETPRLGSLGRCHNIQDLRREARRFLPRAVFDFVDGAAQDERTVRRNNEAFGDFDLLPRVLRDVGEVDLSTELLGCPSALPIALAPTGGTGLVRTEGECDVAAAAGRLGIPCTLSTMSSRSIEEVAAATQTPLWFQLYVVRDRGRCREIIQRARAAGYRALLLTVDTAVTGGRERDLRNGFMLPPTVGPKMLGQGMRRPRWSWQFVRGRMPTMGNFDDASLGIRDQRVRVRGQIDPTLNWDDLGWITETWGGPVVLKGVVSATDARLAAEAGVRGLVVSNHGGRQLDGSPATIDVLAEIVDAVGDRMEVLLDSGVRRGADVARALALGASGCLIGRPFVYGLAAGGTAGVERAVRMLEGELRRTLALLGATSVGQLDRSFIRPRSGAVPIRPSGIRTDEPQPVLGGREVGT